MKALRFTKVRDVRSPERGTAKSAGIDFFVPNDFPKTVVRPHCDVLIPSGIKASVPEGHMFVAKNKSGVVTSYDACVQAGRKPKKGAYLCSLVVGANVVDEDYQGEIHIHLINTGTVPVIIKPGTKIVQFVLVPVTYCDVEEVPEEQLFIEATERGDGGFGSTNKEDVINQNRSNKI